MKEVVNLTDATSNEGTPIHFGVDWITVTARDGEKARNLWELGQRLMLSVVTDGNWRRPWSFAGFNGEATQGIQCGERESEAIVRLSSESAKQYWQEVYDYADNCSRIDIQCTVRYPFEVGPTLRRHFEGATRFSKKQTRPSTLSVLSTNNGPSTVYFNKRVSDRFGRIYDKGAESGLQAFRDSVRYEVEFKGKKANAMAKALHRVPENDIIAALHAVQYFVEKGVNLGKSLRRLELH